MKGPERLRARVRPMIIPDELSPSVRWLRGTVFQFAALGAGCGLVQQIRYGAPPSQLPLRLIVYAVLGVVVGGGAAAAARGLLCTTKVRDPQNGDGPP